MLRTRAKHEIHHIVLTILIGKEPAILVDYRLLRKYGSRRARRTAHTSSGHSRRWLSCASPTTSHASRKGHVPSKAHLTLSGDSLRKQHWSPSLRTVAPTNKRNANPNFNIHNRLPNILRPSPRLPPDFLGVLPTHNIRLRSSLIRS